MNKFTVILLRPDYIADDDAGGYGQDIYVASITCDGDVTAAIEAARKEVFKADRKDGLDPGSPYDYALVLAQCGHPETCLYGWQE